MSKYIPFVNTFILFKDLVHKTGRILNPSKSKFTHTIYKNAVHTSHINYVMLHRETVTVDRQNHVKYIIDYVHRYQVF